ncbi:hypothetical protein [Arsukibacterium sp.]|uniref:hypothetical protein n=1 Tax=Arsukibacterium sp. TaxID=1977258 RepID=UPI002FDB5101
MSMLRHHLKWHKYYLNECLDSLLEAAHCEFEGLPLTAESCYKWAHNEVAQAKEEIDAMLENLEIERKYNHVGSTKKALIIHRILLNRVTRCEWHLAGRVLP